MIRRKNIERDQNDVASQARSLIKPDSKETVRSNKYNYLANQLKAQSISSPHFQPQTVNSFLQESLCIQTQQQKQNQELLPRKSQNQSLLKKPNLYDGYNFDLKYLNVGLRQRNVQGKSGVDQIEKKEVKRRQIYERSISPLREIHLNSCNVALSVANAQDDKTRRIESTISDRKRSHFTRTSRCNVKEPKEVAVTEDDLQAKYQQLWRQNQTQKQSYPISQQMGATTLNFQKEFVLHASPIPPSNQFLWSQPQAIRPRHNSILCETSNNEHLSSFTTHHKNSVDHCKSKKNSPRCHIRLNYEDTLKTDWLGRGQPQWFHSEGLFNPQTKGEEDTDLKLKIVNDFSSKISVRIRELTASIEKMRCSQRR